VLHVFEKKIRNLSYPDARNQKRCDLQAYLIYLSTTSKLRLAPHLDSGAYILAKKYPPPPGGENISDVNWGKKNEKVKREEM
jgi:hypothetical protein